jgi:hypothetical protein
MGRPTKEQVELENQLAAEHSAKEVASTGRWTCRCRACFRARHYEQGRPLRKCLWCGKECSGKLHKEYCSNKHRQAAYRHRQKLAAENAQKGQMLWDRSPSPAGTSQAEHAK